MNAIVVGHGGGDDDDKDGVVDFGCLKQCIQLEHNF